MRHLRSILSVVATTQLLAIPHGITAESPTRGGTGDAFPYVIRQHPATRAFDSTRDYFAVDAVSWFVNRQGNWRQSEQASGTVKIKAGPTDFSFPLGAFQLEKGAVTSPIFNIPVVPTTPFDGSPISISASIVGLRKNTALGAALRDIANAAVTYGTTALNTMALTSYPGLPEVSATATKLSNSLVDQLGEKPVPIFDSSSGVGLTLNPADLRGDEIHVLLFRGRRLDEATLTIASNRIDVLENNVRLSDGAWVLFRIRRESIYAGSRPWTGPSREAINLLELQMQSFSSNPAIRDQILETLKRTPQGTGSTLGDKFSFAGSLIQSDKALTNDQIMREAIKLNAHIDLATRAVNATNAALYFSGVEALNGRPPSTVNSAAVAAVNESLKASAKTLSNVTNFANINISDTDLLESVASLSAEKQKSAVQMQRSFLNELFRRRDPNYRIVPEGLDDAVAFEYRVDDGTGNPLLNMLRESLERPKA